MHIESMINISNSFNISDVTKVNKESVLKAEGDIEKGIEIFETFRTDINNEVANRNLKAKLWQEEVTMHQIVKGNLTKQQKVLIDTKELLSRENIDFQSAKLNLDNMQNEIIQISDNCTYNGQNLFQGNEEYEKFKVPSVRLGGKMYLTSGDFNISNMQDLSGVISKIDSAIMKIDNEIGMCITKINENYENLESSEDFCYADASMIKNLMQSLKNEIYVKGVNVIKFAQ